MKNIDDFEDGIANSTRALYQGLAQYTANRGINVVSINNNNNNYNFYKAPTSIKYIFVSAVQG